MTGAGATRLGLLAILAVAAAVRLVALESVPRGLHGDEAVTGLEIRRALAEGWLGPYLYPSALGQPAGPVYAGALLLAVLPESTATLRATMALFGVATVACTYLAGRAMFGRRVGLIAAALLAVLPWHLHLSRTAFMVNAWPCVAMAALWMLFRTRRRSGRAGAALLRHAGVGALAGLGIYTYNAYPLTLPVLAVPYLVDLWRPPAGRPRRVIAAHASAAAAALCIVALPMVEYARTHEEYFWHQEEVGVTHRPAWREADWRGRAALLAARGGEWAGGMVAGGRPDDGDGLGGYGFPVLDPLVALLAAAGVVLALRRRDAAALTLLAGLAVLPWGALLTVEDGLYRRTYALAPLLCLLAALPLARLVRAALVTPPRRGVRALAGLAALALAVSGLRGVADYFGPLQRSEPMRYVFAPELDAAARFVAAQPPGARIYWHSERWPAVYETLRWHAPAADVVERAPEFGAPPAADGGPSLALDGGAPAVVMLLGAYRALGPAWEAAVPGGSWHEGRGEGDGELLFRAYVVAPAD